MPRSKWRQKARHMPGQGCLNDYGLPFCFSEPARARFTPGGKTRLRHRTNGTPPREMGLIPVQRKTSHAISQAPSQGRHGASPNATRCCTAHSYLRERLRHRARVNVAGLRVPLPQRHHSLGGSFFWCVGGERRPAGLGVREERVALDLAGPYDGVAEAPLVSGSGEGSQEIKRNQT